MENLYRLIIGDMGGDGHDVTKDIIVKTNKNAVSIRTAHNLFVQKYGVGCHYVIGQPTDTIIFCDEHEESSYNTKGLKKLVDINFPDVDLNLCQYDFPIQKMYLEMAKFVMPDLEYQFVKIPAINTNMIGYGVIG